MKPSSRPPGITLLAILFIFLGLLSLMLAPFGRLLSLDLATGLSSTTLAALLALCGLLCFLSAWGLWRVRPWGRWLALGLALLDMGYSLLSVARWLRARGPFASTGPQLVELALWAAILGYLCLPSVRQAFQAPRAR
ncbi:MAG TPA: hypothetical protein VE825_14005 [Terriglobales bacterium]|nr:hypothetical protein [Terriglobales bacterium]